MASAQSSPPTQSTANLPIVVQDRRRKGFFTIDNACLDRFGAELGPYGLAVYIALARFANQESLMLAVTCDHRPAHRHESAPSYPGDRHVADPRA